MKRLWVLLGGLYVFLVAIQGRSLVFKNHYFEMHLSDSDSLLSGIQDSEFYYWAEVALDGVYLDVYAVSDEYELIASGPALLPVFPFREEEIDGRKYTPFSLGLEIAIEFDRPRVSEVRVEFDLRKARLEADGEWISPEFARYHFPIHYTIEDSSTRTERGALAVDVHEFVLGEQGYTLVLRYPVSLDKLKAGVALDVGGLMTNENLEELPLFHFTAREERQIIWAISKDNAEDSMTWMDNARRIRRPY